MPGGSCVGRWRARGRRAWRYAVHERNPITQALYVALVCGGVGAALLDGRNEVTRGEAAALLASAAAAMFSFVSVSRADPGRVTAANHAERVRRYACDELIFYSGAECRTCRLEKPARSKHCRFCGVCVARYDHHCVWINSCVGEGNAALFLLFLAATLVLLAVAAAVVFGALLRYVARERLMEARFRAPDGSVMPATRWMVFMYVNHHRQALALVAALVALMLPVVGAFFAQHVFLAATNATTNERAKRAALAKITADDLHAHLCEEADAAGRPHPPRDPARLEAERVAFCKRAARNPYSRGLLANLGEVLLRARRRG